MSLYDDASLIMYPSGVKSGKIYCQKPTDGTGDLTFTRASTATRVNASGLIEDVASGVPRIDYSGGGCGKLLLEPQRTNLLRYSESFDNAAWTKGFLSVSENVTLSPDGTTNADKLIATSTTGDHFIRQIPGLSSNTYTFTCYAKKAEYKYLILYRIGSIITTFFNLDTGVVDSAGAGVTASIEDVGNGWYRCIATYTYVSGIVVDIAISNTLGVTSFLGDDTSGIYVWGADFQVGSYPTSYIPTSGAAVTRVKDAFSITNLSTAIGTTNQYVWYVEMHLGSNGAGLTIEPLDITGNRIGIAAINRTQTTIVSGAGQVGTQILTYLDTDIVKVAAKYNAGTFNLFVNGAKASGSATTTASGVLETFRLYSVFNAFKMQSTMLYPLLSDAEIIELTTI